jgi:hypothetical protein
VLAGSLARRHLRERAAALAAPLALEPEPSSSLADFLVP